VSEKRYGWPLSAVASKFLLSGWDFFWATLLIAIIGCCSVGRAWRVAATKRSTFASWCLAKAGHQQQLQFGQQRWRSGTRKS